MICLGAGFLVLAVALPAIIGLACAVAKDRRRFADRFPFMRMPAARGMVFDRLTRMGEGEGKQGGRAPIQSDWQTD